MLTIEEIKKRQKDGKRKWRSSIMPFIQEKLDEDMSAEYIVDFLSETYGLTVSIGILYQIKSKYYRKVSLAPFSKTLISPLPQKTENSFANLLHQNMYDAEKEKSVFDFGDEF
jgi:IS30 family transposase